MGQEIDSSREGAYPLLRHHAITTALSLPTSHTIFLGDCAADRRPSAQLDNNNNNNTDSSNNSNGGGYYYCSKPVMVLDLIWNLAFVLVSIVVLFSSFKETPSTPLRIWVSGYAFQCALHVGFVYFDYCRRRIRRTGRDCDDGGSDDDDDYDDCVGVDGLSFWQNHRCMMKRLESINTMVSSIWWLIGFYWIVVGGQALLQDAPRLYWLTVVFLAFDVFFIIFCIGMASIVFLAVFCCIPILAVAYAVAIRKGASEDDIRSLPKYKYRQESPFNTLENDRKQQVLGTQVRSGDPNPMNELVLLPEDSECCICLSRYVDGVELYTLPCNHHFHCRCISKWLRINATCPLCKFNIHRGDTLV